MTITPEQIDLWRSVRSETQNLEFKEAKRQYTHFSSSCIHVIAIKSDNYQHKPSIQGGGQ